MARYTTVKNGVKYEYEYPRAKYFNNTAEYNREYWNKHKEELTKKKIQKRIIDRIDKIFNENSNVQRN